MSDQNRGIERSEWLPVSAVVSDLQSTGDGKQITPALLNRLASGSVHAICTSSMHTYGTMTFSETGLAAIPAKEWAHYVADSSTLELDAARMQWMSEVALPLVGLCPIVATYSGVQLSVEDLIREFPEVPWSRRREVRSTQPATTRVGSPATNRRNNVIDLEGDGRFRAPLVSRRSAPRR